MPARLRFYDFRNSRGATVAGLCQGDSFRVAELVNTAQERLVFAREAGDTGWWGSWAEMVFNVSQDDPYITTPRDVARLIRMNVCQRPIFIQNQFYEYLDFGVGNQPNPPCATVGPCQFRESYTRNNAITFVDLEPPGKKIRVYLTDTADTLKRVFIQGLDSLGNQIYTLDGLNQVQGVFLELGAPFTDTAMEISELTGIQKDITYGQVKFYEVDTTTGDQRLLLTMEPGEEVAGYRRYFINGLPRNCCNVQDDEEETVQITALAKLELVPVKVDTDYLLIQNLQALIYECQSIRHSEIDDERAKSMAQEEHIQAIRLLQGQLVHYLGKDRPAIEVKPFGSASLHRQGIGSLI